MNSPKRAAIFLDRDGTINLDKHYVFRVEDLELEEGAIEGLKKLTKFFELFIITNQAGVGKGLYTEDEMHLFNKALISELQSHEISIRKIYYSTDHSDFPSETRKPSPYFLLKAVEEFDLDLSRSWMIGDKAIDVQTGNGLCKTILVLTGKGKTERQKVESIGVTHIAENLNGAADHILLHH